MPSHTPSQVRRAIRLSLRALLDPELTRAQRETVKSFFEYSCAFCGVGLKQVRGHVDHLVSVAAGGTNHISNRVFACSACNGDEKLDRDWQDFLRFKNADVEAFSQRRERILLWSSQHRAAAPSIPPRQLEALVCESEHALKAFDRAVQRLRKVKRGVG